MSINFLHQDRKNGINKIVTGIKLAPIVQKTQQKVNLNYRSSNIQINTAKHLKKPNTSDTPFTHGIKKLRELKNSQNENKSKEKLKINRSAYSSNKLKTNNSKIHLSEYNSHNRSANNIKDINSNNFPINFTKEKDIFKEIADLWQELGVSENYKKAFEEFSEQLDSVKRNGYYEFEHSQLSNSKEILLKVYEEITAREKAIELFGYIEIYMRRKENEKSLIDNIISTIQNIRVLSINIVNHFIKFRKICSYDILNGKYDLSLLQTNLKIDLNYILKMNNDTDFLANSSLSKYFTFSKDPDPFFTSATFASPDLNKDGIETEKKKIPIEANLLCSIKTCQYYILQELAYCEMNRMAIDSSSKYISSVSSYNRNLPSAIFNPKIVSSQSNHNLHSNLIPNSANHFNSKTNDNKNFFLESSKPRKLVKLEGGFINVSKNENNPMRIFSAKLNEKLNKEKLNDSTSNAIKNKGTPIQTKTNNEKASSVMRMKKIKIHIEHEVKENIELKSEVTPKDNVRCEDIMHDVVVEEIYKNKEISVNKDDDVEENEKINLMIKKIDDALKESQTVEKSENLEILVKEESKLIEEIKEEKKDPNTQLQLESLSYPKNNNLILIENEPADDFIIENVQFEVLKGNIKDYQSIYEEYVSNLNDEQKIMFNINKDLAYYIKGNFPKILKFTYFINNTRNLCGIAVINYDSISENIKLVISQFSTIHYKSYDEIFKKFINYLQNTFHFKEIYLELHYGNNNKINIAHLTEIISKKNKFRWIALENTEEGRKTKYRYINPEYKEDIEAKATIRKDPREILSLVTCIVANAREKAQIKIGKFNSNDLSVSNEEYDVSLFPVTCLLSDMIHNHDFESDNQLMKKFKHHSLIKFERIIKCFGSSASNVEKYLLEHFKGKETTIHEIISYLNAEDWLYSVLMKINLKFENVLTVRIKDLIYNRIHSTSMDILEHPDDNHKFYLIKTSDQNFSVVISQIEESSKLKSLIEKKSNENLTALFFEIYSSLIQTSSDVQKNIFLPTSKIIQNRKLYNPKSINEIDINCDGEDYAIEKFCYLNEMNFQPDNYKYCQEDNFHVDYNESEDIFIDKDYIISVINSDILNDLNIPIVSVMVIRESDFLR